MPTNATRLSDRQLKAVTLLFHALNRRPKNPTQCLHRIRLGHGVRLNQRSRWSW
jgi:hypothetical protein